MSAVPPPPLPTVDQFRANTDAKKGRSHIGVIDEALGKWKVLEPQPGAWHRKKKAAAELMGVCVHWLAIKSSKKEKGRYALRKGQVETLGRAAHAWLRYATFESAKWDKNNLARIGNAGAAHFRGTTGLKPGYTQERSMWVQTKATGNPSAISMSNIHNTPMLDGSADPAVRAIWDNKEFDQMTVADVICLNTALGQLEGSQNVWYMRKQERMSYMLVIEGGRFYSGFNEPFVMQGGGKLYPYAINEYGNIFATAYNAATPFQNSGGFDSMTSLNHSSFNAGKDVITAGTMYLTQGTPCIDNNSGHYKPTVDNLHNGICMLDEDGLKLSDWYVGVVQPDGRIALFIGTLFRANKNVPINRAVRVIDRPE
jgi:hypothetical protein